MKIWLTFTLITLAIVLNGCSESEEPSKAPSLSSIDIGEDDSYSNIYRVSTKHLHLDLDVNFDNKSIYGIARHEIENNHADTAIFDIKGLQIQKVTIGKKGKEINTSYILGMEDSIHGAPLSVLITPKTRYINIYYQTTDQTTSLHWNKTKHTIISKPDSTQNDSLVEPAKAPDFVYTLPGEEFIRNWIPIQDIGYRKINYSATIRVPKGLLPLMGTINPTKQNDSSVYHFSSNEPVSLFEIGLTIGDFKHKKLSEKLGVYFISKINKSILKETKLLPLILNNIEKTYGKSPWPTTNFIILPDSSSLHTYTYPCSYFMHPSLFSKYQNSSYDLERFLLTHWPSTFFSTSCKNNIALETGINNYYLHRFVLLNYGKEQAELASKLLINKCLLSQREDFIPSFLPPNVYTRYCSEKRNVSTKEIAFKQLKGYLLMQSLETNLGTKKLDKFVRKYLAENQIHSLSDFERELNHFLIQEEVIGFPLKTWLYSKKIPSFNYKISSKRHLQIHIFVKSFLSNKRFFRLRKTKVTFNRFTPFDWLTFISLLPNRTDTKKLSQLDNQFHLTSHPNKNIQAAWIRYGIKNNYLGVQSTLQALLARYGDKEYKQSFHFEKTL